MGLISKGSMAPLMLVLLLAFANIAVDAQLVPALIIMGDSAVDVGNNNYLPTLFKANYPPYGRDFTNHQPTGRFCNGKLATDITAETLGFTSFPPAYLSPQATGKNLLIGANFASAAAGYDDKTSFMNHAISLSQQLEYFQEYKKKLQSVDSKQAPSIIEGALYLVSAGSSDFFQNYYVNPLLNKVYTPDQYGGYLVGIFSNFVKVQHKFHIFTSKPSLKLKHSLGSNSEFGFFPCKKKNTKQQLYGLGARRIGVTSLPPLGCLPAARTLFGYHQKGCVANFNTDAQQFNKKLNAAATQLQKQLPGLKLAIFDIFNPIYDVVKSPSNYGFKEATRGCCGTGTVETTVFLCNEKSPGTCSNATEFVFWDAVHPSEAANRVLADSLIAQGISLIG
ncbi:OLC1v1014915C1 [Oldenlandia corymbosa var. corymbosa]|uniref:OLC1v1014915C1 n=1 Tax=Oldenlandia corymbosa var. corymbosa TaxID=529605 RepID=A0AAV1E477_OLDCO|nr:OLC1v1014915C1 [Oldenlandia corymbosa var. corymbosa]